MILCYNIKCSFTNQYEIKNWKKYSDDRILYFIMNAKNPYIFKVNGKLVE